MVDFNALLDQVTEPQAPSAPPVPASANMDGLLDQVLGNPTEKLDLSLAEAAGSNPDDEAKRRKYAAETGMPAALAPTDAAALADGIRKRFTSEEIIQQAPRTANWLSKSASNARVAGLDIPRMVAMERTAQFEHKPDVALEGFSWKDLGMKASTTSAAVLSAFPSINAAAWGYARMGADIVSELITGPLAEHRILPEDIAGKMAKNFAERSQRQSDLAKGIVGEFGEAWGGSVTAHAAGSGLQSFGLNMATLPFAVQTQSAKAAVAAMSLVTGGQEYQTAREQGADLMKGVAHSTEQFAAEFATEFLPAAAFMKTLPKGYTQAAISFAWRDVGGEQLATVWQDFNTWVNLNPEKTLAQFAEERPGAAYQTFIATLVGGGSQVMLGKAIDMTVGRQPQEQANLIDTAMQNFDVLRKFTAEAESNPLRTRSPEAFKEYVDEMVEEGVSEVFVPAATLSDAFAQAGITQDELQRKMPEVAAQMGEAQTVNGDVRMPLSDYATYLVGTPVAEAIMPHLRTEAGGMTFTEAEAAAKTQTEDFKQHIEKFVADIQREDERAVDLRAVRDQVAQQLDLAGRFTPEVNRTNAMPIANFYASMADRLGMKPSELYAKYPYKAQGESALEGEQFAQGRIALEKPLQRKPTVNIGLNVPGGGEITADDAIAALGKIGIKVDRQAVHVSDTEPTLVAQLSRPLTPEEAHALSAELKQEAIVQVAEGKGALYGPAAEAWGEFNPEYFLTLGGKRLAEAGKGVTVQATHFSNAQRARISGKFFGTGIKGREGERLNMKGADPRLKNRIAFYVDEGRGVRAEQGLGRFRHEVTLTNMYDTSTKEIPTKGLFDPDADVRAKALNDFESAVLDAGYNGYYTPQGFGTQGVAVLLGDAAEVQMTSDEQAVKAEVDERVAKELPALKEQYLKQDTNKAGVVVIDVDDARELFPAYAESKESRSRFANAVHEAASTVAKAVYADVVKQEPKPGHEPLVVFTGGGTGAGKSSIRSIDDLGSAMDRAHIIYDSVMSNFDSAKDRIDLALTNGKSVAIFYVVRDPVDALVEGALPRAESTGRTAPIAAHAAAHRGSAETIQRLAKHYADNPEVAFTVIDNTGGRGEAKVAGIDILADAKYDGLEARLLAALEKEKQDGKISERTYQGTKQAVQITGMGQRGPAAGRGGAQPSGQGAFSQEGVAQTDTPEFKKWFGDSKVVDAEGKPLVVYHGTIKGGFDEFDFTKKPKRNNSISGEKESNRSIWFTSSEKSATRYANGAGGLSNSRFIVGDGEVKKVYISLQNPLIVDMAKENLTAQEKEWTFNGHTDIGFRKELVVKRAKSNGNDGVVFLNALDGNFDQGSIYAVFEPTQIKSAIGNRGTFDPNDPNILLQKQRAAFDPSTLTTTLLSGADLSSTLHESAHFYLEVLTRIASEPDAPAEILKDVDTTLQWGNIPGLTPEERLTNWRSMPLDQQRNLHEQWAQSNERWMLEGKAPTVEMQSVFARFRAWMLSVYKSVEEFLRQNPLAGKLNDEMRAVFSRMLASEEQIKYAETVRGYAPLFENAEQAGTTERSFDAYINLGKEATEQAVSDMQNRSLRDIRWLSNAKSKAVKALQSGAASVRKEIRDQVAKDVMLEPINQARTFLKTGNMTDPTTGDAVQVLKGYKLDLATVKEMYPETMLARPDIKKLRGMAGTDGLHPDLVAQMFGLRSGDALVRELIDGESAKDKIEGETDRRMLEEHGELIDTRSIELAAEEAIHNEARARFLATGLKMLTKTNIPARTLATAAKQAAEAAIAAKKVRALRPLQYSAAEARANKEALKLAPTDPQGAVAAQRAALLNNRLAKAANEAVTEVQQLVRYLKKFENLGTRKNIDLEYVEQIDSLLAPFDMSTGVSLKEIDKRTSLIQWVQQQEALGFQPAIDAETIEKSLRKNYKDMTVEELRGLADTIKQVEHLGRLKKKLLTAKDAREFATRMAEATDSIARNANRRAVERATPTDVVGTVAQVGRQLAASHRKFASLIREMDGSKDGGVMWELLTRPKNEAANKETEMKAAASAELAKLFKPIQHTINTVAGNIYSRSTVVPGTNISMTHEQRIMFAMNWGNEGNRQRLMDGGLTGKKALSTDEAQAILDTLTKEEWDFVQSVLDYVGGYRDQIAEQERALTGVEPKWIEPAPIETKFGVYQGGYFPAKYDAELSTRSEALEAVTDLRQGMKGAFGAAAARNGYAKERANSVIGRPILLSFDVISRHVNEVVHRLSWQYYLTDASRTLRALDEPIREYYGVEVLTELRDTVSDIATGDSIARTAFDRVLNHMRVGSTIVGLGWRVTTALLQPAGIAQSWVRVGGKWMSTGVLDYLKAPLDASAFVNEKSHLMRDRGRTMQREINEVMNVVRKGQGFDNLHASYFYMIGKLQRSVDIPTWLGAYNKALDQLGLESAGDEAARKAIDDSAVAMADQAVIDSQGSGLTGDLAKIQRGSPGLKLFTNFYSYFSATYNLNVEAYRRTHFNKPAEVAAFAVDMLLLNTVPVLFSYALKEMLKGNCEGDIECLAANLGREQANYMFGQMIPLREIGSAVEVVAGGHPFGYSGPAGLRFFNDLYKLGQQTAQGEADLTFWKAANSVSGAILHYPAGQINSTMDGIIAIENGEVEGVGILPALIAGAPKK